MSPFDPFETQKIRAQTLRTWRDNPQRFREDANTEEDHARGYYRDRVIIELAQNAADAAEAAGGKLRFSLDKNAEAPSGWALTASNTGHPLTGEGVASLSGLRASVKRTSGKRAGAETAKAGGSIGHFGVGFSAVRAVSDDILVRSIGGGVRFSLQQTLRELREIPADSSFDSDDSRLAQEITRRGDEVPILRLPWSAPALDFSGSATQITLALRDDTAVETVRNLLNDVDDRLLLALPQLQEITVKIAGQETRQITDLEQRWCITRHTGQVPGDLLESLPVEQRERAGWTVTWATPLRGTEHGDSLLELVAAEAIGIRHETLFAPTPTDEPVTLPGFVIATLPLEPTRRRVRPGAVADWVIDQVGAVAVSHAQKLDDPLELVPTGLPAGEVDAALHAAVQEALADAPLLKTLEGRAICPREAAVIVLSSGARDSLAGAIPVLDAQALAELASGHDGIVDIPHHRLTQAALLDVQPRHVADTVAEMPAGRTAQRWQETYESLSGLTREVGGLAALASLPVPLVDGRVVSGARGVYLVTDDLPTDALKHVASWGPRILHPGAQHSLLESLGALSIFAGELLSEPEIRERATRLIDHDVEPGDPNEDARDLRAFLHLVASSLRHRSAQDPVAGPIMPWLADLPLPTESGEVVGAGGVRLADSRASDLFYEDELVDLDSRWASEWPIEVWRGLGVRDGLIEVRQTVHLDAWDIEGSIDTVLDDASVGILDLLDEYLNELADYWLDSEGNSSAQPEVLTFELASLADLDIVRPTMWAEVEREARAWLDVNEQPVLVPGREEPFAHYLRWWLGRRRE